MGCVSYVGKMYPDIVLGGLPRGYITSGKFRVKMGKFFLKRGKNVDRSSGSVEFHTWLFPKIVVVPPNPKSSHFNRVFHYFHHPFWGTVPIFGSTPTSCQCGQSNIQPHTLKNTSSCSCSFDVFSCAMQQVQSLSSIETLFISF